MFTDLTGRTIGVGDIIAYTTSSEGASAITLGRVTRFTAKSLWVQDVKPDFTPAMQDDGFWRGSGRFYNYGNPPREIQEFVKTGEKEVGESIIGNPRPHRFYIVKKI
jgi:hypothetical protein